jgi:hypothetical protein
MIEARAEVPVELRAAAPIYARRRQYVNMTGAFTCTGRRHRVHTWTKPGQGQAIAVQVVGRWGGDGLLLAMPFCFKGRSQWPSHEMWNPLAVICSYLQKVEFHADVTVILYASEVEIREETMASC